MNQVSFKDVQNQFILDLGNSKSPVEKIEIIEVFRKAMTDRVREKPSLKTKLLKIIKKQQTPEDVYHEALEKNCGSLLLTASGKGYTEIAIDLISHNNMHVNFTSDKLQQTPLHLSCKYGMGMTAKKLLNNGAFPNVQDSLGNTPLHYASFNKTPKLATFLVKFGGANPFIENHIGKRPLRCITSEALKIMHKSLPESKTKFFSTFPRDIRYLIYGLLSFNDIHKSLRFVNRDSYNTVTDDILHVLKESK